MHGECRTTCKKKNQGIKNKTDKQYYNPESGECDLPYDERKGRRSTDKGKKRYKSKKDKRDAKKAEIQALGTTDKERIRKLNQQHQERIIECRSKTPPMNYDVVNNKCRKVCSKKYYYNLAESKCKRIPKPKQISKPAKRPHPTRSQSSAEEPIKTRMKLRPRS